MRMWGRREEDRGEREGRKEGEEKASEEREDRVEYILVSDVLLTKKGKVRTRLTLRRSLELRDEDSLRLPTWGVHTPGDCWKKIISFFSILSLSQPIGSLPPARRKEEEFTLSPFLTNEEWRRLQVSRLLGERYRLLPLFLAEEEEEEREYDDRRFLKTEAMMEEKKVLTKRRRSGRMWGRDCSYLTEKEERQKSVPFVFSSFFFLLLSFSNVLTEAS